jgi:hypothetical protein
MSVARSTIGGVRESVKHLARVVALAAIMIGVGAVPGRATTITHSFSPGNEVQNYFFPNEDDTVYLFRLGFDEVVLPFQISLTDTKVPSGQTATFGGETYRCVDMAFAAPNRCVQFTAQGILPDGPDPDSDPDLAFPVLGTHFNGGVGTGAINIGIQYGIFGFPDLMDPVDLGQTDNFSTFMVFAKVVSEDPKEFHFILGHLPTNGSVFEDISTAHCSGDLVLMDECAEDNNFAFTAVPEPATFGGVLFGLLSLTALGRRLRRRE